MARKDFDNYFQTVARQYQQLNQTLKDISDEVANGMFEPERLDALRATIAPVKNSYDTLNYIRYLLDKPTRKAKHEKYDKQNKKVLQLTKGKYMSDIVKQNDDVIHSLKHK